MDLRRLLFYLTLFTAPLFTVSPWQKLLGIPVGVIYGVMALLMMLAFSREIIGAFRSTGLNSLSPYPFLIYMGVGLLSLAGLLVFGGAEKESYISAAYIVFSVAVCWAFAVIPKDYDMLMEGIAVYLAGAVVACFYGFYYTVGFMAGFDTGMYLTWTVPRLFGTAAEPQVFGNFIISVLPAAIAFYVFKVRKMSGPVMIPVLWILGLALIMTFAAGSWAGLVVGLLLLLPAVRKMNLKKVGGAFLVVLLISVTLFGMDRLIYPGYLTGFPSIMEKFTQKQISVNPVEKSNSQDSPDKKNEAKETIPAQTPAQTPAPTPAPATASASTSAKPSASARPSAPVAASAKPSAPVVRNKAVVLSEEQSYKLNMISINERKWLRGAAWNMFKAHPLMGVGVGKFGSLYNTYKPPGAPEMNYVSVKAHNQYMEILAETGIIGFIAYLIMFGYCLFIVIFAFVRNFDSSLKFTILGFFASLTAMSVQGYSFGVFYHNYFWVIMGLTYAAFRVSAGNNTRRLFSL